MMRSPLVHYAGIVQPAGSEVGAQDEVGQPIPNPTTDIHRGLETCTAVLLSQINRGQHSYSSCFLLALA